MTAVSEATSPAIGSKEFLRRAKRIQSSPDPDTATAETIAVMVDQIRQSTNDPLMREIAQDALKRWGNVAALGGPSSINAGVIAWAVWWYAKHNLKFVHHEKQIWAWFGERDQLQLLIEPSVLVRMKQWEGDCAIYSMFVCTLLDILGVRWELETLKCNPRNPGVYSHVFARAVLDGGRREPLDASHGKFPGWRVPAAHTFQSQVWNESGAPVADSPQFDGLHNYAFGRGMWGYRGPGGLGCGCSELDDSGNCLDPDPCPAPTLPTSTFTCPDGTVSVNGVCTSPIIPGTAESSGTPSAGSGVTVDPTTGGYVVPASNNTAAIAALLAQVAKSGLTLAQLQAMPAGTVINPNGQIIRQAAGYPVPIGSSITGTLGTLGSSSMIWIFVAIGAVLLIGSKR
jgi:hypothetical protein